MKKKPKVLLLVFFIIFLLGIAGYAEDNYLGELFTLGKLDGEDIYWRVIGWDEDSYHILAVNVLESMEFSKEEDNLNWIDSSLRSWLNSEDGFMKRAGILNLRDDLIIKDELGDYFYILSRSDVFKLKEKFVEEKTPFYQSYARVEVLKKENKFKNPSIEKFLSGEGIYYYDYWLKDDFDGNEAYIVSGLSELELPIEKRNILDDSIGIRPGAKLDKKLFREYMEEARIYNFALKEKRRQENLAEQVGQYRRVKPEISQLILDGEIHKLKSYKIDGNNYYMLRDLILLLSEEEDINIIWNKDEDFLELVEGEYIASGSEMDLDLGDEVQGKIDSIRLGLDGQSYELYSYNVDYNNYVGLRDLLSILDISVEYNKDKKLIEIDKDKRYFE